MGDPAIATANGLYLNDVKALMEIMKAELMHDVSAYLDSKQPNPKKKSRH